MLVEQLGGKPTPAIGFACGIERLMMVLDKNGFEYPCEDKLWLFIIALGAEAKNIALKFCYELRSAGISCDTDFLNRSVKSQMKEANKINSEFAVVIGEEEIKSSMAKLKRMSDGFEKEVNIQNIISEFKGIIKT